MAMNWYGRALLTVGLLALGGLGAAEDHEREFSTGVLEPAYAETLVWDVCNGLEADEVCSVTGAGGRMLTVRGGDRAHEAIARMFAARDDGDGTRTLSFTLVGASTDGSGFDGPLSEEAREILDDVRSLLPFTRFVHFDSGVLRTQAHGSLRLADATGQAHTLSVHFQGRMVNAKGEHLYLSKVDLSGLLLTSLSILLGETVVVGSSRLASGNEGILLLLTAAR